MTKKKFDAFNPEPKAFKMFGREFKYEFIPSEHFQSVLVNALQIGVSVIDGGDNDADLQQTVSVSIKEVLTDRLYRILSDVLIYQNDCHEYSMEDLKKKTRPSEISAFANLVLSDPELKTTAEEYINGLGKLKDLMPSVKSR